MTRLKQEDIFNMPSSLDAFDDELRKKTGHTLREIACHAVGWDDEKCKKTFSTHKVAVVPVDAGQGIISGFGETVKKIVEHIGFIAFVTQGTDVTGLAEAIGKKSDIIMLADDYRFVSLDIKHRRVVDNSEATGRGFASVLELMVGGLKGEKVLIIGCGPVGRSAAEYLLTVGATVSIYDVNRRLCDDFARSINDRLKVEIEVLENLKLGLATHKYLMDASPAVSIIGEEDIGTETYICAPGVPHGLSPAAAEKVSSRFVYDPLRIGVATMVLNSVAYNE